MTTLSALRWWSRMGSLVAVAVAAAVVGLLTGAESFGLGEALRGEEPARFVLFELRLPRVAAALVVGGALAACGAAFQALMRNALASPYILGVSGGGSLGAVAAILLGIDVLGPVSTRPVFAFAGCLAALAVIWVIGRRGGRMVPQTLLLAGVVANAFFLAILGFLNYMASPHEAREILRWQMGGLYAVRAPELVAGTAIALVSIVWLSRLGRALNVMSLGEEPAAHLGIDGAAVRRRVLVLASLLTGAAVAIAGPIGFVGLFVPHAVRFVMGPDHRLVLPASFVAGGAFLVLADALARVLGGPSEIPVGLLTAAVGAPTFVLLLVKVRARGGGLS
ncbi:MAG: iron ABC transporter permease [Planctomycetota bacterium]